MTKGTKNYLTNEKNELVPNKPNAKILISALQYIGYDEISAISDIIDNSIDADATDIKVFIDKDENKKIRITIVDNGSGMDYKTLDEALKLGSDTSHDDISDLGKFGMGLSTAGLALANKTIVFTKNTSEEIIYKSVTDVDIIKEKNDFVKELREANEFEKMYFNNLVKSESGTIVILEDCIGIKSSEASTLKAKLIKNIARIFRNFMTRTSFYVNDIKIEPEDPLRIKTDELKGELFSDEEYEVKWKNSNGEIEKGSIHIKLSVLPFCEQNIAREYGFNMPNQGFSILRNNREIAYGYLPKWDGISRHPDFNRFRGEISFSSDLDIPMGVNFRKNGIEMVDSIENVLRNAIVPQLKTIRGRIKEAQRANKANDEEIVEHENAQKLLNKMSKILTLPKANKIEPQKKDEKEKDKQTTFIPEDDKNKGDKKKSYLDSVAKFELLSMGETGHIYKAEQIGKKIIISWNIDHPFYQKLISENIENEKIIQIVDFLFYTLASAQIQYMADDDDKVCIMDNIISTMSANMRNLLS